MKKINYLILGFCLACTVTLSVKGQQQVELQPQIQMQPQLELQTQSFSRLAQTLQADTDTEIQGHFVERTPGNYMFVPESKNLPAVKVSNPKLVSPSSVGVNLSINASFDQQRKAVEIKDYQVLANQNLSPQSTEASSIDSVAISRIAKVMNEYKDKTSKVLKPGSMNVSVLSRSDSSEYSETTDNTELELLKIYQQAVSQGTSGYSERTEAVKALAKVNQETKSIYEEYDNYPPWSYIRIYNNAKSVVAIAEPGQSNQALCSGVLIGENYVLTAGHCFGSNYPTDLEVWFGFAETTDEGGASPTLRYKIDALIMPPADKHSDFENRANTDSFDADMPDYAIVRIDRPDSGENEEIKPQCLRRHHIKRQKHALYVIGHPKGQSQMVHDNGQLYLPFRLRPQEFEKLKFQIEADFAALDEEQRIKLLYEFTSSYIKVKDTSGRDFFEFHDTRWGNQPKLGIVADLFRGNSGSPVFDRKGHCIIGIHTGGATDTGQRLGASWQTHETVLPIQTIISDLKAHESTARLIDDEIIVIK